MIAAGVSEFAALLPEGGRLAGLDAGTKTIGLVLGLPLNMDGSDSSRTQSVRALGRNLLVLQLPILMWDERWSTQAVERAMIAEDLSRRTRAERVDRLAAAYILQGAIDALTRPALGIGLPPG